MRIARECLKIERKGGDVLAYLLTENYYTPRATWIHLQREFLRRKPHECKDGKPKKEEKRGVNNMALTNEQRLKAAQIAIDGGDPRPYLEECGILNTTGTWWTVKEWVRKNYPEMAEKIPDKLKPADEYLKVRPDKGMPKEKAPTVKIDGALKIETPEANKVKVVEVPEKQPKITKPTMFDGMTIREVEGSFGRYRYSDIGSVEYIDFENNEGLDVMSLTVEQWKKFRQEQQKAALILGVRL
jgi:hypothetical protein